MEPENFADFLLNDTVPQGQAITDIPQAAKDFVNENKDGLQSAFWYKDNFTQDGNVNERLKIVIRPEKPQQPVIELRYTFKESKSIEEAQEFARQFCQKNMLDRTFKGEINYKGISIDNANEINKVLTDVFNQLDMPKISGIKVISPTSVQGKKAFSDGVDAIASYSPVDGGIFLNKDILKSQKTFAEYMKKSQNAWSKVMENIDRLTPAQRVIAMRYKEAGRSLVDETLQGCIRHEIGHHAQWKMLPTNLNNELGKEMSLYANKISGYATSSKSEYLAESFAAYMRGEKANLDPKLVEFLDSKSVSNSVVKIMPPKAKRIKTDSEIANIKQKWNERKLYNKITNTENEIRLNKSFETGVLFDRNGNVVIDKRGAKYSVAFTDEECAKMKDCVFTHNHPRGWQEPEKSLGRIGNSFSPADMYLAIAHNVSEMRAVTPNYTFAMKRPEEGWGITISKFEKLVNRENNKLRAEFTARINNNTLSPTMASVVHYHILWKRISEKMGWNYTKAKTR